MVADLIGSADPDLVKPNGIWFPHRTQAPICIGPMALWTFGPDGSKPNANGQECPIFYLACLPFG